MRPSSASPLPGACTLALLAAALCLGSPAVLRAQGAYVLDRSGSHASFRGQALLHSITGKSVELRGDLTVTPLGVPSARGIVRFTVGSLRLNRAVSDNELTSVFGGSPQSEIIFRLDSVVPGAGEHLHLDGRLTMNGITHPVRFAGTISDKGDALVTDGHTRVDIRRWQMRPPSRLGGLVQMSPQITLTFRAEFRPVSRSRTVSHLTPPDAPKR